MSRGDLLSMPIYQQSMQSETTMNHSLLREGSQKVKVIIVGPSSVGKSSIAQRFIHQVFDPRCSATLGAAFMEKSFEHPPGRHYTLQMWDTTGQERYRAIARIYYQHAKIALLVYDVTSPHSFAEMKKWGADVINTSPKDVVLAVVANKMDLLDACMERGQKFVDKNEAKQYAESIGAIFHKTSAKSDQGVNELFQNLCDILHKRQSSLVKSDSFILGGSESGSNKRCCF